MNFLTDTSVVSLLMREDVRVQARVDRLAPTDLMFTSVITEAELEYGLHKIGQHQSGRQREALDRTMTLFVEVVSVDRDVAATFASVKHALVTAGRVISVNDTWIAAIAIVNNMTLIHRDRDFSHVPNLQQQNWTE